MRFSSLVAVALLAPSIAWAAGADDDTPPKPTQTASDCKAGEIFDKATKSCVDAKESRFDDDTRYDAVRELAYAIQYDRALLVLSAMSDQNDSRVLTYRGFIARKTGDLEASMEYYARALQADADNILARSYFGQALVEQGSHDAAAQQLAEIRARGGRNTWAEFALSSALDSGVTFSY